MSFVAKSEFLVWNEEFKTESDCFRGIHKTRKDGSPYLLYELNANFLNSLKTDKCLSPSKAIKLNGCHISAEKQRMANPRFKQDKSICHMTLEFHETRTNILVGRVHVYLDHTGKHNGNQAHREQVQCAFQTNDGHSIHLVDQEWGFISSLIQEDQNGRKTTSIFPELSC